MKKKNEPLTKYWTIYDTAWLLVGTIFFAVGTAGFILLKVTGEYVLKPELTGRAAAGHMFSLYGPYVTAPLLVFYLRTRLIDQKGVSAKFLGIRYKYIKWDNLMLYRIKMYAPRAWRDKNRPDPNKFREAMFFTSKPNRKGKSTVIIVYATEKNRALVEKYFGPPESVSTAIGESDEKEE